MFVAAARETDGSITWYYETRFEVCMRNMINMGLPKGAVKNGLDHTVFVVIFSSAKFCYIGGANGAKKPRAQLRTKFTNHGANVAKTFRWGATDGISNGFATLSGIGNVPFPLSGDVRPARS